MSKLDWVLLAVFCAACLWWDMSCIKHGTIFWPFSKDKRWPTPNPESSGLERRT